MKKIVILALVALMYPHLSADIKQVGFKVFTKRLEYPKTTNIGFEIVNKSDRPIWIAVKNGADLTPARHVSAVPGLRTLQLEIDTRLHTNMLVWHLDPGKIKGTIVPFTITPRPQKIYRFTQNKTIYITWDKRNFPRPETGPFGGLLKKTDSNLSMAKNVKKNDIEEFMVPASPRPFLEYPKTTNIGFEIVNKSDKPIWIAVRNGADLTPAHHVSAAPGLKTLLQLEIDARLHTNMLVWHSDPGKIKGTVVPFTITPRPEKVYVFDLNKTIYITWDKKNFPRPQTGPTKTDSNLRMVNNVKKNDIKEIRPQKVTMDKSTTKLKE